MQRDDTSAVDHPSEPDTIPGREAVAPRPEPVLALPTPLSSEALQAWGKLRLMRGPGELRAILLALLLTPGSARERQAWQEEVLDVATAAQARRGVERLPASARLPALEAVLGNAADLSLAQRQNLLRAARRVMCADGRVRPLDRLALLLTRHRLNGPVMAHRGGARDSNELTGLPLALRLAIAELTAYLARLVPSSDPHAVVGAAGAAWHRAVVHTVWGDAPHPPACQVPDSDALVRILRTIQGLGWMRRPVLARAWLDAVKAAPPGPAAALALEGAEALRMACGLLDTPVPPELARHFNELPQHG